MAHTTPVAVPGGNSTQPPPPPCHGHAALTYTHPTMTVSSLWCGSRACLFFRNPLKVALNGKRTKRPQCYYRKALVGVLIWWVCESGPALWRGTNVGPYCLVWPKGGFLILVVICNLQRSKNGTMAISLCVSWGGRIFIDLPMIDKILFAISLKDRLWSFPGSLFTPWS